jgi:hypothetical protein
MEKEREEKRRVLVIRWSEEWKKTDDIAVDT